jgi:hypothetical protein
MTQQEISKAKDPDLQASVAAIQRAAQLARKIAMQTGTAIVIARDKKMVRISADELRKEQHDQ